jgi:hypothetical protein
MRLAKQKTARSTDIIALQDTDYGLSERLVLTDDA